MSDRSAQAAVERRPSRSIQFRIWHLLLLVLFVAIAIANIQDQRISEPLLVGIAAGGFVLYGFLGWFGWRLSRTLVARVGRLGRLLVYLYGMAALFLAATMIYVVIEQAHRDGWF